ncbi:sugar transporter [Dacryopinax primogenitus]|uniref:Sugar transporter n=1 Tax=Dacryopinax primogenitus (strain DJM 731) TaxID=1858805 RepID=M5FZN2_DACPD|nr:sugar transporter [Dacryopinax primogenitus]EJU01345.1 sugar transporter [Dacryopinax primogenitus]
MSKEVAQPEMVEVEDAIQQVNRGVDWELEKDAHEGAIAEHSMAVKQALAAYWKAVCWSVIISWAVIMESYDIQIIGSFYAYPTFQQKYCEQVGPNSWQVPSAWQVGLSVGSNIGIMIGILLNGYLIEKFGHRRLLLVALCFQAAFIFITFFAPNIRVLLVGEILCGLPWGVFNTVAPSYAVEVCPLALRGYLTTFVNLCWVIGHLIAAGVLDGLVNNTTEWSYRIPFAIQWVWPLPLFIAIAMAPDSPWWLVRKNRVDDAEKSIRRLATNDQLVNPKDAVALIVHTTRLEASLNIGASYAACFQGTDLRHTEIACVSWASQAFVGFAVQSYSTYFFEQAGMPASDAFKLTLGTFSIAFCGTVSSWFTQTYFGRRTLFLAGTAFMGPLLFVIGFLQLAPVTDNIRWAQAVILVIWFGGYGATIGPIPYVIAAEISSSNLRTKTISVARDMYYLSNLVNSIVSPYMLNPQNANLKGKAAFPAACFNVALFVWAFFRLPESKGRTFEELDILFAKHVPARKFVGVNEVFNELYVFY